MTSYYCLSTHHNDYVRHSVEVREENGEIVIWLYSNDDKAPSLAFDIEGARILQTTIGQALSEAQGQREEAEK